ncbi:DUF4943 family protein [Pedobacter sp. SYSU D00535]|uniref:DUF4943 family protein n=1 Tax=Pedobacter sp. SYSU D00535 TaxID=2810308 RepID=UPI001A961406|nr:DUF4943 family protein [Pedobacter sp. SYSU D00535]
MKTLKYPLLLVALIALFSCDKKDNDDTKNVDVQTFVELLKSGKYDSSNLPSFTYQDIPALLQYRNETQLITNFPRNPISSLYGPECKLGMYVLWTVESIRAVSANSKSVIMGFPSQNPTLALKNETELRLVSDDLSHSTAAEAYYNWWTSNKNRSFDQFKDLDPLKDTPYRWH